MDQVPQYDKIIKSTQTVGVLGKDLAGDSTNFYTGATTFSSTDLAVPGNNGLSVAVGRVYAVEYKHMLAEERASLTAPIVSSTRQYAFGDWDLDIPYLKGTFSQQFGWQLDSTTPEKRCSVIGQVDSNGAPATGVPRRQTGVSPIEFWNGNTLHLPGDDQSMLVAAPNTPRPTMGGPYHWTTNKDWWISCLTTTTNDPGEGFLALAPDGTKYWFNHVSRRKVDAISRTDSESPDPNGGPPYKTYWGFRADVFMLPTRIEDRFGNWVAYSYSSDEFARLLSVTASDGRKIDLNYNAQGLVSSISDGTRTIGYAYNGSSLAQVLLPDGSSWRFGFDGVNSVDAVAQYDGTSSCNTSPNPGPECIGYPAATANGSAYVIHPAGARVDFTFKTHFQWGLVDGDYVYGLVEKLISGPGIDAAKWYYTFAPTVEDVRAQCGAGSCPTRVWTDEISPDYRITRRMFGTSTQQQEGVLLQQLRGLLPVSTVTTVTPAAGTRINHTQRGADEDLVDDATPTTLTNTSTTITGTPQFFEETDYFYRTGAELGINPVKYIWGSAQVVWSERRMPVSQRKTYLQGESFTWQADTWDATFDRPLTVTKLSTLNPGRSEATDYQDDLAKWVIGLVRRKTTPSAVNPIEETVYDANLLPWKLYSFGKLQQTLTYNSDGTLATVSDARDGAAAETTVTLSGWKRGIPQLIQYPPTPESPTGSTQSAQVNNVGWIDWVKDENGFTTLYGYDAVGRLKRITYPTGDTPAWNDTTISFAPYTAGAEFGIASGHWKQTVTTGAAQKITYFDAMWRPLVEESFDAGDKAGTLSQTVKRYDGDGRVVFQSLALRGLTDYAAATQGIRTSYDALGRPARSEQDTELGAPAVTTVEYLAGFKRKTTNPRMQSTIESFQGYEAPSFEAPVQVDAPENVRSSIVRDVFGKPTQITRGTAN